MRTKPHFMAKGHQTWSVLHVISKFVVYFDFVRYLYAIMSFFKTTKDKKQVSYYVPVKSKLQQPPTPPPPFPVHTPGIWCLFLPGREFDELSLLEGRGHLIANLDFMLQVTVIPRGLINHDPKVGIVESFNCATCTCLIQVLYVGDYLTDQPHQFLHLIQNAWHSSVGVIILYKRLKKQTTVISTIQSSVCFKNQLLVTETVMQ